MSKIIFFIKGNDVDRITSYVDNLNHYYNMIVNSNEDKDFQLEHAYNRMITDFPYKILKTTVLSGKVFF